MGSDRTAEVLIAGQAFHLHRHPSTDRLNLILVQVKGSVEACRGGDGVQDKEKLLTDLRKVLSITNDQHFQFLEEVTDDKLVTRLREAKNTAPEPQGVAASHDMPPPRQSSNPNRKPGRPSSGGISPSPPLGARPPR